MTEHRTHLEILLDMNNEKEDHCVDDRGTQTEEIQRGIKKYRMTNATGLLNIAVISPTTSGFTVTHLLAECALWWVGTGVHPLQH